jgi:hypothetical protein
MVNSRNGNLIFSKKKILYITVGLESASFKEILDNFHAMLEDGYNKKRG